MATEQILFHERQRPHTVVLVLIILAGIVLPLYIAVQQLWLGRPFGNHPMSNTGVAILVPCIILLMLALATLNLDTRLYPDRLRMRLLPFADDSLPLRRIVRWEVRSYSATKEFMGWGVRFGVDATVNTTAYTMRGKRGVQLVLDDGSRVLVGSQKPDEIALALRTAVTIRPPS